MICLLTVLMVLVAGGMVAAEALDIGSRRELFVDESLIEGLSGGAQLRLHRPIPQEVALVHDQPWEGNGCGYFTVFQDGERYRMYYRGAHGVYNSEGYHGTHREVTCYAESTDGIHWTKPELGLFEFEGSKQNNLVWDGLGTHAFGPFLDAHPNPPPEAKYKALGVGGGQPGLYAFQSPDGIHWSLLSDSPVITQGAFDSQNLAFWDTVRGEYRAYVRDFREGRDIRTCTSPDFRNWTEPAWLEYQPGRISELYTNQVLPYFRAPHLFLGFPTRYFDRGWTESHPHLPRWDYRQVRGAQSPREGSAVTDGMFMSSRDGRRFQVWPESFIRPGLRTRDNWFYGDNYQAWGLVETRSSIADAPNELSLYVSERTAQEQGAVTRRYTLRLDGFVSVEAPLSGGELLTKPLVFQGNRLTLNFSTSGAGSLRVELQQPYGAPVPGLALEDCPVIFGDDLERTVSWKEGSDLSKVAGQPVRLRFVLHDADLFAFQFQE